MGKGVGWGQRDGHLQGGRQDDILKGQGWKDRGTGGHRDRETEGRGTVMGTEDRGTEGQRDRGTQTRRGGWAEGWRDRRTDRGTVAEGVGRSETLLQLCTAGSQRRHHSCTQLDPGGGASLPHLGTAGSQRRRDARHTAGSRDRLHIWARLDPGVTTPPAHSWLLGSLPHLGTAGSRYWGGEGEGKGAESSVDPVTLRTIP